MGILKKRFQVEDMLRQQAKIQGEHLTNTDVIEQADEFVQNVRHLERKAAASVSPAKKRKTKI